MRKRFGSTVTEWCRKALEKGGVTKVEKKDWNVYPDEHKNWEGDIKLLLCRAILYRQWAAVCRLVVHAGEEAKKDTFWESKIDGCSEVLNSLKKCLALNADYLCAAKNRVYYEKLANCVDGEEILDGYLYGDDMPITYDTFFDDGSGTVFDVVWDGRQQPVLDVTYKERQTLSARQVMKHGVSMVIDEVGTGKTVAAIYAMQRVVQKWMDEGRQQPLGILVVCPYNKREDWASDILRQLGRTSHVIKQEENAKIWLTGSKKDQPHIYICGNNKKQLNKELFTFSLRKEAWDLVIVDECDNCFGYDTQEHVNAKRVMFLTATPIKVSGERERTFDDYVEKLRVWTGRRNANWTIRPIENGKRKEAAEEDIFTCNFKEDIFDGIRIERDIRFLECERDSRRQEWFRKLRYEDNFFSAIFADQDDQRLADEVNERLKETVDIPVKNHKLELLRSLLEGTAEGCGDCKRDSVLIFCETVKTVTQIYNYLTSANCHHTLRRLWGTEQVLIGKLYSQHAAVKGMPNVNNETIIDVMTSNIRGGGRSILVSTGKSGGTGLNFGEFHAVVHYELPFTSNELEQRFGRIERADDLIREEQERKSSGSSERTPVCNKMIFLLNKRMVYGQDKNLVYEDDVEANRMLYYSINKIYTTVNYMPIRNTVLFAPRLMERVKKKEKKAWEEVQEILNDKDKGSYFKAYGELLSQKRQFAAAWKEIREKLSDKTDRREEEQKRAQEHIRKMEQMNDEEKIKHLLNHVADVKTDPVIREKKPILEAYQNYLTGQKQACQLAAICEEWIDCVIRSYLLLENMMSFWNIKLDLDMDVRAEGKKSSGRTVFQGQTEIADEQGDEIDDTGKPNSREETEKAAKAAQEKRLAQWSNDLNTAVDAIREQYVCRQPDGDQMRQRLSDMCGAILNGLEGVREDNKYSGVFYRYNGRIENINW